MKKYIQKLYKNLVRFYMNLRFPFLKVHATYGNHFLYKKISGAEHKYKCNMSVYVCSQTFVDDIKSGNYIKVLQTKNPWMYKNKEYTITNSIDDIYGTKVNLHSVWFFTILDTISFNTNENKKDINIFNRNDIFPKYIDVDSPLKNINIYDITDVCLLVETTKYNNPLNLDLLNINRKSISLLLVTNQVSESAKTYVNSINVILDNKQKYILRFYNIINNIVNCVKTSSYWYDIPLGWRKAFGLQMCKDIKHSLIYTYIREDNISKLNLPAYINAYCKGIKLLYSMSISQIKEKFGTLRVYMNSGTDDVYRIIDKYEDLSYNTCITCGKPAEYISHGWISPYCADCVPDKDYASKIKKDADNTPTYKKIITEWTKDKA